TAAVGALHEVRVGLPGRRLREAALLDPQRGDALGREVGAALRLDRRLDDDGARVEDIREQPLPRLVALVGILVGRRLTTVVADDDLGALLSPVGEQRFEI